MKRKRKEIITAIIECELELKRQGDVKALLKRGDTRTLAFKLEGRDSVSEIDWILTLKTEGRKLPPEYLEIIGEENGNHVTVKISSKAKQSKLQE